MNKQTKKKQGESVTKENTHDSHSLVFWLLAIVIAWLVKISTLFPTKESSQ